MSTVKSKKLQVGTDATASNNFTIYQPASPDGTLRIGVGNADSPTEVGKFDSNGYVATNAPAFSATQSSGQSISTSTETVLVFDTIDYDVTNDFNTSTYKFTPSVAGYYLFTGFIRMNITNGKILSVRLQKNDSLIKNIIESTTGAAADNGYSFSTVVYANGTTDNFRLQLAHTSGVTETTTAGSAYTTFQGTLATAV